MPVKLPHPVDVHVGSRFKLRRMLLGKTQAEMAGAVGLTFQQIQKYERGANRVSSSRLHQFSQLLDVPISFFFDDMPDDIETRIAEGGIPSDNEDNVMMRAEALKLARLYYGISTPAIRKRLFELVKSLAYNTEGKSDDPASN